MSLLLLLRFHGEEAGPQPPVDQPTQTPAGRKRRERKYVVEIDGREFTLNSAQEALNLLERAKEMARVASERQAEIVLEQTLPKALLIGKAPEVRLDVPRVSGPSQFKAELAETRRQIKQIYKEASQAAELRMLLALEAERDDEETILLSM